MRQMINAVVYLHEKKSGKSKMVHRDIKPENFLLFKNTIKICDFGISRENNSKSLFDFTNLQGTPIYIAPELINNQNPDNNTLAIDMLGLGMTFYIMCTFKLPWEFPEPFHQLNFDQMNNLMLELVQQPIAPITGYDQIIGFLIQ